MTLRQGANPAGDADPWLGPTLLVIENVPVLVCASCDESYLTAETLHEIERIKLHRRSLAKSRKIPVASFG